MRTNKVNVNSQDMKPAATFLFVLFLLILLFGTSQNNFAQENKSVATKEAVDEFNIKTASFLLPQALPEWKFSHAFSIYYVVPPKDWTLDMVKAPFLNY